MTTSPTALHRALARRAGDLTLADVGEKRLLGEFLLPLARAAGGGDGLGDDAAVVPVPPGHELIVSSDRVPTDLLARRFGLMTAEAFGRYAVRVNASDVVAMAGEPLALVVTAAFPATTSLRHVIDLMWGCYDESARLGCPLVGGDTKSAAEESVSATMLGSVPSGGALRRGPIAAGDDILVSGPLGTAGAALRWLAAGIPTRPDTATRERLVAAIVAPMPRLDLTSALRAASGLKAGMDITDGLGQSLVELADASGVGMVVQEEAIPLSEPATTALRELRIGRAELVGGIGNDLELLLVARADAELPFDATRIGVVTAEPGVRLAGPDGGVRPFPVSGFEHFRADAEAFLSATPGFPARAREMESPLEPTERRPAV